MRYAFISDIHGNLHALEVVLADLQHAAVDRVICLGDVASLGPQPHEVVTRLRQLQIPVIQGNHEAYLLNPASLADMQHPWLRAAEQWCLTQLTAEDLAFMRSFPTQLSLALDHHTTALCFHGSPRSNEEWLYPTALPESLDEIFAGVTAQVLVGGHTHVQMARHHHSQLIINPGSVGMPFEFPKRGPNQLLFRRAEYALVEMIGGKLTCHLCRLPIDFDYLTQTVRASGLPEVDFWLSMWTAT